MQGKMLPLGRPPGLPPGTPLGAPPGAPPVAPPMPPHAAPPGGAFGAPPGVGTPPGGMPPHAPPAYPPPGAGAPYGAPPHYPPPPGMPPAEPFPPGSPYPPEPPAAQPPYPGAPYGQSPYSTGAAAPLSPVSRTGRSPWLVTAWVIGGLLLLGVIGAVVRYATLSPSVSKIEFAHNFQNNRAVDVTDTFKSTDPNLYAIIHLTTTKGTPNVNVVWTVVNGTDAANHPVTGLEFGQAARIATDTLLSASVTRGTSPWPVGRYKIDVFLDGKLAKTAQFTVTA